MRAMVRGARSFAKIGAAATREGVDEAADGKAQAGNGGPRGAALDQVSRSSTRARDRSTAGTKAPTVGKCGVANAATLVNAEAATMHKAQQSSTQDGSAGASDRPPATA